MPVLRSANPDFERIEEPTTSPPYPHAADRRRGGIPMAFQITSPFNRRKALLPHALVLHVNPSSLQQNWEKKIERTRTRGGHVEWHWWDNLTDLSAEGSTGAFINIQTGLSSALRHKTIAWDRYRSLLDLFYHNGAVYDPYGSIVLQGQVMLMFDRGVYLGTFRSFSSQDTESSPYMFQLSWSFKVEEAIVKVPRNYKIHSPRVPSLQTQNMQGVAL